MESKGASRRELLAGAAGVALGTAADAAAAGARKPRRRIPKPHLYDVAAVGAGLAGLTAAQAPDWDEQTIATWMTGEMRTQEARDLGALAIRGVYGEESSEISLLDLLQAISGVGGDFNTLIGSAQSIRFVGGPQQLSQKLAQHPHNPHHPRGPIPPHQTTPHGPPR